MVTVFCQTYDGLQYFVSDVRGMARGSDVVLAGSQ